MEAAQLFTVEGNLVATVEVEMTLAGKWPRVLEHLGRTFALENGRYVEAQPVTADALAGG